MTFKLNTLQQNVFNAINEFNPVASFEYAEWLEQKERNLIPEVVVEKTEKLETKVKSDIRKDDKICELIANDVPPNCFSKKVAVRMLKNGINTYKQEFGFLTVDLEERQLAQQIDEVVCSFNTNSNAWNTAFVTRANGKAIVAPYPTVPQFLKRTNLGKPRKRGIPQHQPLNFSKAAYVGYVA